MHDVRGLRVERGRHGGHRTQVHLGLGHVQGDVHASGTDENLAVRNLQKNQFFVQFWIKSNFW